MAFEFYAAMPGGRPVQRMGVVNSVMEPYRQYLHRAEKVQQAQSLGWRLPTEEEARELWKRWKSGKPSSPQPQNRRRDRQISKQSPSGHWVILESASNDRGDEAVFTVFSEARRVFDRLPMGGKEDRRSEISVSGWDDQAKALLLSSMPTVPSAEDGEGDPSQGAILYVQPNTYVLKQQKRAVEEFKSSPHRYRWPLLGLAIPGRAWDSFAPKTVEDWVFLTNPDRSGADEQRRFVEMALGTPDFAVLEGPPGSGKTTAICELICQLVRQGKRVLLVASTHVAVDNVLEKVIHWQDQSAEKLIMPIRIGDDQRVSSERAKPWILSRVVDSWTADLRDFLDDPKEVMETGDAARGDLAHHLMANKNGMQNLLLDAANLVCGTTIGILQHPDIRGGYGLRPFDVMILDEASKTSVCEFLVPALHAKRWIIVGDRRQLSPYVDEQELRTNLKAQFSTVSTSALLAFFYATERKPQYSLISVDDEKVARWIAAEAAARQQVVVDLDKPETHAYLPGAAVVYGRPATIEAQQSQLPGDIRHIFGCEGLDLADWRAHQHAVLPQTKDQPRKNSGRTRGAEDEGTWEDNVSWRLIYLHSLRDNPGDAKRTEADLKRLLSAIPEEAHQHRRLISQMKRVALPSILEVLQQGAGEMEWGPQERSVLTHGFAVPFLESRMVSLSYQHRMHPDISAFPRQQFYGDDNLLNDAQGIAQERAWGYSHYSSRAVWLDVAPESSRGNNNTNSREAEVLLQELRRFADWAEHAAGPGGDPSRPWEVAVLTFYRPQERYLRDKLRKLCGQFGRFNDFTLGARVRIRLATVDSFQGQEADLVLLSFVKSGSPGFLSSPNRLNVALTRARFQIVLIGHRAWMKSKQCKSDLLQKLAMSSCYAHTLAWEGAR